jgi:hypothetical protein
VFIQLGPRNTVLRPTTPGAYAGSFIATDGTGKDAAYSAGFSR